MPKVITAVGPGQPGATTIEQQEALPQEDREVAEAQVQDQSDPMAAPDLVTLGEVEVGPQVPSLKIRATVVVHALHPPEADTDDLLFPRNQPKAGITVMRSKMDMGQPTKAVSTATGR